MCHLYWWISVAVSQHWFTDSAECVDEEARVATIVAIRQRNQSDGTEKEQHERLNGQTGTHDSTKEAIASRKHSVVDVFLAIDISFPIATESEKFQLVHRNIKCKQQIKRTKFTFLLVP